MLLSGTAFEAYDASLGPAIVTYSFDAPEGNFHAGRTNQFNIVCTSLGQRQTSFDLIVKAINVSLFVLSEQDYIQVNSTTIKIPFALNGLRQTQSKLVQFTIDQNVTAFELLYFIDYKKGGPIGTGGISGCSLRLRYRDQRLCGKYRLLVHLFRRQLAMKLQKIFSVIFLAVLLAAAASTFAVSTANPLRPHEINVVSPKNSYIYSTGDVWLQFTPITTSWNSSYSSYSYVLDGNDLQVTDGNTLMTNLPAGSHQLTIYGNRTSGDYANQGAQLEVIYFSVSYSSNWVTFILSFSVVVAVVSLVLFVNRRPVVARLRAKKNGFFWLGLTLIILAALFAVPMGWNMLSNYLFPYDTRGAAEIYLGPFVTWGFVVMGIGVVLMVVGTMQIKFSKWEPLHPKKK